MHHGYKPNRSRVATYVSTPGGVKHVATASRGEVSAAANASAARWLPRGDA